MCGLTDGAAFATFDRLTVLLRRGMLSASEYKIVLEVFAVFLPVAILAARVD
jgi:hypothetical protein